MNVSDIAASTKWYATFFGQAPHKEREGYANFDLEQPALKLAIQQVPHSGGGALNHLGLLVADSDTVWAARKRLEDAGLASFTEENVDCCFATQDKFWVRDPDGNQWEVYTILDDRNEESCGCDGESGACCVTEASTCCA